MASEDDGSKLVLRKGEGPRGAVVRWEQQIQSPTSPRQTGKVSFDELFPGFDSEAFIRDLVNRGIGFGDAIRILSPSRRNQKDAAAVSTELGPGQHQLRA